jgi:hypothetical protein
MGKAITRQFFQGLHTLFFIRGKWVSEKNCNFERQQYYLRRNIQVESKEIKLLLSESPRVVIFE